MGVPARSAPVRLALVVAGMPRPTGTPKAGRAEPRPLGQCLGWECLLDADTADVVAGFPPSQPRCFRCDILRSRTGTILSAAIHPMLTSAASNGQTRATLCRWEGLGES
jgi:hypothetical protein